MQPLSLFINCGILLLAVFSQTLGRMCGKDEELYAEQLEGRILRNKASEDLSLVGETPRIRIRRNHAAPMRLWPYGVVYYVIDESLRKTNHLNNASQAVWNKKFGIRKSCTEKIKEAFKEFEEKTCVKFKPRTDEMGYINLQNGTGYETIIGRQGTRQDVNLQIESCLSHGCILHQLGHAIGLMNTHMRPDRDKHIIVICNNILPQAEHLFDKFRGKILAPYDMESIMHFDSYAYSSNGRPTILKLKGGKIKESTELSPNDVTAINSLYSC